MHRASPTLLVSAACTAVLAGLLAACVAFAAPARADSRADTPRPVLLAPHRMHAPALAPGDVGAKVSLLQQRLVWLGYPISASNIERQRFGQSTRNALRSFQSKNWLTPSGRADRATWRRLSRYAEPLGILPLRCTEVPAAICVDKTTRTLRYVVDGSVVLTTDARFGRPGMETDEGIFSVKEKAYDHTSTKFGAWMPRAMFFSGDQAVHYSPDFNAYGYAHASHGCIGIRDLTTATRLFEAVDLGTRVYVYWS